MAAVLPVLHGGHRHDLSFKAVQLNWFLTFKKAQSCKLILPTQSEMDLRHNPQLQLRSASAASRPTVQPLHTPGIVIVTTMVMIKVIFAFARNSDITIQ